MSERIREFPFHWDDFEKLRKIANQYSGIVVSDDKFEMYYARLTKRIRQLGLKSFGDYIRYLEQHRDQEFSEFINAITTNLSYFFREQHHFEFLREQVLPEVKAAGRRELQIWSAGCSTGEEPYSIAMSMLEPCRAQQMRLSIQATDIDSAVLAQAESGIYGMEKAEKVPLPILKRWFLKGKGNNLGYARVIEEAQAPVSFARLNLIGDWSLPQSFDVIFCRNVVIYFDRDTKHRLIQRFVNQLRPGGYLFLGHSESIQSGSLGLLSLGRTIYQKPLSGVSAPAAAPPSGRARNREPQ